MEWKWNKLPEQEPQKYKEVIVALDDGKVKTAVYMGNSKWSTYCTVVMWTDMPASPIQPCEHKEAEEPVKKKRGRKKKVG